MVGERKKEMKDGTMSFGLCKQSLGTAMAENGKDQRGSSAERRETRGLTGDVKVGDN